MYSVQCGRRGAGRAALYRTVRGVLVTIGERSGADSVGGAAESESDGTGSSVQCSSSLLPPDPRHGGDGADHEVWCWGRAAVMAAVVLF